MEPIEVLKARAMQKRDLAIAQARRIYQRDLAAIEALGNSLPVQFTPEPTAVRSDANTTSVIQSLIPPDKPFTVADMMNWLNMAQPGKKFHEPTIRTYVSRLASRGVLKRLYKNGRNYTRWVASEAYKELGPLETKTIADLIGEVIQETGHPMRGSEIAAVLREKGYRPEAKPATINTAVNHALSRHREKRFVREMDGKWNVATD